MTDGPELRPCPFCNNDGSKSRLNVCEVETRHVGWVFTVECTNCGADGPCASSEKSAATLWNNGAKDDLQAAVAAERVACAKVAEHRWREWGKQTDPHGKVVCDVTACKNVAAAIRARTDTDEQAALEAVKREARNKALKEVEVICNRSYGGPIGDVHKAILALMEDTDDE